MSSTNYSSIALYNVYRNVIGCPPGQATTNAKQFGCCVFPFWYNNKMYFECTKDDASGNPTYKPWCATHTAEFPKPCYKEIAYTYGKKQMIHWDYCA